MYDVYSGKVYLYKKCSILFLPSTFTQNMCKHDILKFKTHEMNLFAFITPFFISHLMSEICHAQTVKGI